MQYPFLNILLSLPSPLHPFAEEALLLTEAAS